MPDNEKESKKNVNGIEIILFLIGFIGIFITTIIWWSRLHPWFSHGQKIGKSVYQSLFACWILSLLGVIVSLFLLISNCFLDYVCSKMIDNFIIILVIGYAISIGSIVSGACASSYALTNPKYGQSRDDNKCLKYISYGFTGASIWAIENNKVSDFVKWSNDMAKHTQNDEGTYNGYLCRNVGASTLTFVIVLCIAIVFSIYKLCKAICLGEIYG